MKKKRQTEHLETASVLWKILVVAALLFVLAVLASSALIYYGVVPVSWSIPLIFASIAAEAFGATVFLALITHHGLLMKALLVQGIFLGVLLLLGLLTPGALIGWGQLAISVVVAAAAAAGAVLAFGGRKKKKIKKNSPIRLKKK